jgi:PilZ domain
LSFRRSAPGATNFVNESTLTATDAPPLPTERRASVRFRCARPAVGRAFIAASYKTLSARVLDLSRHGVGLSLTQPLEQGTQLTVELESHGAVGFELLAEIVNVAPQADGSWRCGCRLVWPISEDELQLLLK